MCINDASLLAFFLLLFLVHLHSASRSVSSFKLVYGAGDRTRTALKGVGGERGGGGGRCCWCCGVKSGLSMYAGSFVGLIGWGSNVGNATQMHLERFAALFVFFSLLFFFYPPVFYTMFMLHATLSVIYTSLSFFFSSIALSDLQRLLHHQYYNYYYQQTDRNGHGLTFFIYDYCHVMA